jgi:catechol 2,3-dioxygenase-like lactoylglutathione lyase family enzyme
MIKGVNHVGISVSNLERSIEFYRNGLGMEIVGQGKFERGTEEGRYEAILGLEGATGRVALMAIDGVKLELFEFSHPTPKRSDPKRPVCDHGITHFCVEVEDIQSKYDRLKAAGASFHCPPLKFFGKATATYGRDPDGNVFELLETNEAAKSA